MALRAACRRQTVFIQRPRRSLLASEAEGPESVKKALRVLKVHVITGGPSLSVSTLQIQDFLGDASGDGGGEAPFAGRDAGEVGHVGATRTQEAPDPVADHLRGEGGEGGDVGARGPVDQP